MLVPSSSALPLSLTIVVRQLGLWKGSSTYSRLETSRMGTLVFVDSQMRATTEDMITVPQRPIVLQ